MQEVCAPTCSTVASTLQGTFFMANRAALIEDLHQLREAILATDRGLPDLVHLAVRIADGLESRGIYSVALESFVHSPDGADRHLVLSAINAILQRLAPTQLTADVSQPSA